MRIQYIHDGPKEQILCHSSFSDGIICGLRRGSFEVRDHLRSNLGIISGLGIICGRGSFAALYKTDSRKSLFLCSDVAINLAKWNLRSKGFFEGKG